jgi:hypothetical protein
MLAGMALRRDTPKSKAWADRRTPLPRGKSLDRGAGLARGGPMRHRSPTMDAYYAQVRRPLVERMTTTSACEAPLLFALHRVDDPLPHCAGPLDVHERRRRSQGGSLETPENLLVLCRQHHDWVGLHDAEAHAVCLVAHQGDPGYESLGARRGERKQRPA